MKRYDAFSNMRKQRQLRENREARARRIAAFPGENQQNPWNDYDNRFQSTFNSLLHGRGAL